MLKQYTGYNNKNNDNTCIGMCFFNPVEYKKPKENIDTILKEFSKTDIPVYLIELVYPGQKPTLNDSIVVQSSSIIFSKENLWNILEKHIPDKYTKIVFMDCDVLYSKPSWFNDASDLLDNNDVIQCMEWSHKDIHSKEEIVKFLNDPFKQRISFARAIKTQQAIDLRLHHMGFCVGIRRDFFHKINGFFEYAITGYGDTLFWSCFSKDFWPDRRYCTEFLDDILEMYTKYRSNVSKHYVYPNRVDYVSNCLAMHLYHGSKENRKYTDRRMYIPDNYEFFYNDHGVLELKSYDDSKKDLKQYWIDRKEDE